MFIDIFGSGNQTELEEILTLRGRLRDQYSLGFSKTQDEAVSYILGNIIASHFNATLITFGHSQAKYYSQQNFTSPYPIIIPYMTALSAEIVWKKTYNSNKTSERPTIFKRHRLDNNFAYCSVPEQKYTSATDFTIFTDPFDVWTWLILLFHLVTVSILVSISIRQKFFTTFMSALAVLLDNEMTQVVNSKLYVLWLFITLLIFDFYSGAVTSEITAPPEEVWLTRIHQLEEHNYTLIFPDEGYFLSFKRNLEFLNREKYNPKNLKVVTRLVDKSQVFSLATGAFSSALTERARIATLMWWPFAMFAATRGNNDLLSKKEERKKRCVVGSELFNTGEIFVVVTPPGSSKVSGMLENLQACGIFRRWNDEYLGMLQSTRVQDRARVKSWASLAKEATTVDAIELKGKAATIFLLWWVCLVVSFICFIKEIMLVGNTIINGNGAHMGNREIE